MRWPLRRKGPPSLADRYRAIIEEGSADSIFDLVGTLDGWLGAAFSHGGTADRADALYYRTVALAGRARDPVALAERERLLIGNEGVPAEAGYWLARAGRLPDAVVAVETSRAILFGRLTGWLDPDLRAGLLAAGHAALVDAYVAALTALSRSYRAQYAGQARWRPGITVDGRGFGTGHTTALQTAAAEVDALHRRIERVTGRVIRPLEPVTFSVVRRAAAVAPVVYLGAAAASGYALIVTAAGRVDRLELPELTAGAVERQAGTVRWLSEVALAPLAEALHGHRSIGLVAIGATGALPVAAGLLAAGGPAVWHLPYARALLGSSPRARRPAQVRVCAAPEPRTRAQKLPRTDREVDWLEHRYAGRVRADRRATVEQALGAFREAEVVEFLGHGKAHPTAALDSALLLSDGDLTVRRLLGQDRCAARLVILSACESQVFDPRMTDEIIGLPLALHQAGASAVIAGQWTVGDIATALLMRRLHDALLRGAPAAEALATAQNWLRTASRKDLRDAYPDAYRMVGADHSVRPFSDPAHWAGFTCSGYWTEGTDDG